MGSEENRLAGPRKRSIALLVLAALVLFNHAQLAAFDPEPYGTVSIDSDEVDLFAPAGGSPALIFLVAALLFFGEGRRIAATLGQPAHFGLAIPLLAVGAGLGIWADYVGAPELLIPAMISLVLGSAALLGGKAGLRAVAIPAGFLIFAFPIPAGVVNLVVWPLQRSAAWSSDLVLGLMGFASERFGDIVVLDDHTFMVIETCSGMRMIETLVMASALYAILFYRTRKQVLTLLLLAPLVGYFVNLLRVLSIIFNPYSEWSSIHETQGVVMLVVGVLMIAGVDALLLRRDPTREPRRAPPVPCETFPTARFATLVGLLLVLGLAKLSLDPWQAPEPRSLRAFAVPKEIAGSRARGLKLDRQFYGSVGISRWLHREYDFEGERVALQILADDRLDRRGSLLSAKTAIPGRGLVALSHDVVELGQGEYVDRHVFLGRNRRILVYHWYENLAGPFEETVRNALALDRGPWRRPETALSIRLTTPLREGADGLARADSRLRGFVEEMRRGLQASS